MMKKNIHFLGIDIGGAHTKLIGLDNKKSIIFVNQLQFPIWKGTENLNNYFKKINKNIGNIPCGITMTAELCDNFKDRLIGVKKIIKCTKKLKLKKYYFCNQKNKLLINPDLKSIASMNWLATAEFIKEKVSNCIVVDFGSTSTDLILIKDKKIINKYYDDFGRLNNSELVYTGLTRTPTSSLTNKVKINNKDFHVMSEFFSNTADLYRINKLLSKNMDLYPTCDFRSKSIKNSYKRLARNFGIDFKKKDFDFIHSLSKKLISIQLNKIFTEINKFKKINSVRAEFPLIICGIGKEVMKKYCKKQKIKVIDFKKFLKGNNSKINEASYHAPATSCALMVSDLN